VFLTECLACGGRNLHLFINLGEQPLANAFHRLCEKVEKFPLGANVCTDCWHSQLAYAVNPDLLFKNYLYTSGTTSTLKAYFHNFVETVEASANKTKLRVLDIASNDGSLLKVFKDRGHEVQGVDPAENLQQLSQENGVPTHVGYWDAKALTAVGGNYDVIVAMNVLAHTANPLQFLSLCKETLAPDGSIYVQTSQAKMLANGEFDTIYHEHISFFTSKSFLALAERAGLHVEFISQVPIHGTSYLVKLKKTQGLFFYAVDDEKDGYFELATYERFRLKAWRTLETVVQLTGLYQKMGFTTVGYGAAAKGMTFLNAALGEIPLHSIIDDNPLKVGLLTPGQNIPVAAQIPDTDGPILFLILAWNFYDEIRERIRAVRPNSGDAFLTYFPDIRLSQ
jgi:SAM-dependent methyltransferase